MKKSSGHQQICWKPTIYFIRNRRLGPTGETSVLHFMWPPVCLHMQYLWLHLWLHLWLWWWLPCKHATLVWLMLEICKLLQLSVKWFQGHSRGAKFTEANLGTYFVCAYCCANSATCTKGALCFLNGCLQCILKGTFLLFVVFFERSWLIILMLGRKNRQKNCCSILNKQLPCLKSQQMTEWTRPVDQRVHFSYMQERYTVHVYNIHYLEFQGFNSAFCCKCFFAFLLKNYNTK